MPAVCVQPLMHRARESEDFTRNKSDETDAVIIARLVTELRCYLPERADPGWGRLRHLGPPRAADRRHHRRPPADARFAGVRLAGRAARRRETDDVQELAGGDDRAAGLGRDQRRPEAIRRWGWSRFAAAVRRQLPRHGTTRWYSAIVRAVFDAATDPALAAAGVADQRAGALERTRFALGDLAHARAETAVVQTRMVQVLDELGLAQLVTSIRGLSAVGAAAILAETGDPTRFSSARAVVKHAGSAPGRTPPAPHRAHQAHRPRPARLRLAAWRAVHGALQTNPVYAARYAHLTGRTDQQAHPHPGQDRRRRQPAAPTPRRPHHRHRLGPRDRRRPHPPREGGRACRITPERAAARPDGASPPPRRDHNPRVTMGSPARLQQSPDEGCREPTRLHAT